MVIFIDIESQTIDVYNKKGKHSLPLLHAASMAEYLDGDPVYYVTNAMEVDIYDVINLVRSMGIPVEKAHPEVLSSTKYIHAAGDQTIFISKDLKFQGKMDIREIDENMRLEISNNKTLQMLIKKGRVEIINELQKAALIKKDAEKFVEKGQKEDKALDKMILNTRHDQYDPNETENNKDMITIDLTSEATGVRPLQAKVEDIGGLSISVPQTMSELEKIMGV